MLRLRTFGGLTLTSDSRPPGGAATQRRPLGLLAILAATGEQPVTRERLQTLLWPERDEAHVRRVLAQTVYALRRDLGDPAVVTGTAELRINTALLSADVVEFERAVAHGELEQAAALYVGPFLDGLHLADAPQFEPWADRERTRLGCAAHRVLERLAHAAMQAGDVELAAGWWQRLAAFDPLNGRVALGLMEALSAAGDDAGALRHARIHEALLDTELGAPPDPAVTALAARLRAPGRSAGAVARAGHSAVSDAPRPAVYSAAPSSGGAPAPSTERPPLPQIERASPRISTRTPAHDDHPPRRSKPLGLMSLAASANGSAVAILAAPRRASAAAARIGRRGLAALGVLLVASLVVVVVVGLVRRERNRAPLDPTLLVVAPFDAADPALQPWREGLMDALARNLEAAGALRTVSPTVVSRQWTGRADRQAVTQFARALHAGTAVYGGLVSSGADSVLASVTLLDVRTAQPLLEFRRREAIARMDRLTDSVTFAIVRALARPPR